MAFNKLVWIGLFCCIAGLLVNLFPRLTFELGMNPAGAWVLFAFGVFLILASAAVAMKSERSDRDIFR